MSSESGKFKEGRLVQGKDPQLLVEKIIRERIYDCLYWKEECFGLNAETILDKAVELTHVGGTYGNQKPVPFVCLLLKLLQIQPSDAIIEEYILQEDFKYLRILGLLYVRMTSSSLQVYNKLEPLLADRRKIRIRHLDGTFSLTYLDEIVDEMLTKDRIFGLILPRLTKRSILEDTEDLPQRPFFFPLNDAHTFNEEHLQESVDKNDTSFKESLSVEETNAIRHQLGLKPLSL